MYNYIFTYHKPRSQDFFLWGDAYLNNRDQIINVGKIGHASAEDIGESEGIVPWKKIWNWRSSNC